MKLLRKYKGLRQERLLGSRSEMEEGAELNRIGRGRGREFLQA